MAGIISSYGFWLVLGLGLLVSELMAPGIVAIFFGIGALVVGGLTFFGLLDGIAAQLLCFALVSSLALFALRRHFKRWLRGDVSDRATSEPDAGDLVGARVKVLTDFEQGHGDVQLNGAKWDAESEEPLKAGDAAWVLSHRGILLKVAAQRSAPRL
ncbi:MAG TPA: NfeD family protein [Pseudomonas xinjiangensis]|uniref:NfeD family protein n=2 Tax=root TaxID=1 RepID=A0A7V1BM61_9GAMM|nr:NfeD family protein [Halopseudomonas xinjiangensis]HEC46112.1 NfeD family protein [Halopseudomonas xinjiangensis]